MKQIFNTLLIVSFAITLSAQDKGLEVANAADAADAGYGAYEVDLRMELKNANGQESSREMKTKTLEVATDGDKSLIIFESPRDVKGTAMLTFSHKTESDDQWLFLPSIKRVKRISSNNKSGPFMGSEIAYEDLGSQEVEKYTYKFVENSTLDVANVAVVERYPVDKSSGYSKQVAYYNLDKDYRMEKLEFYDRRGSLLKTMDYNKYKQYKGQHWRAAELYVVNHQSNKETKLLFSDFNFDVSLSEDDFSQNSLKRAGR